MNGRRGSARTLLLLHKGIFMMYYHFILTKSLSDNLGGIERYVGTREME